MVKSKILIGVGLGAIPVLLVSCKSDTTADGDMENQRSRKSECVAADTDVTVGGVEMQVSDDEISLSLEDIQKEVTRGDSYSLSVAQMKSLRSKVEAIAAEEGVSVVDVCLRMIPEDATELERSKYVFRMCQCYKDSPYVIAELAMRGTSGLHTEGIMNWLKRDLIQEGDDVALMRVYSKIPPGSMRVKWSSSLTGALIKESGVTQAVALIKDMKYPEDQKAALEGTIMSLRSNREVVVSDAEREDLISLAEARGVVFFRERLERALKGRKASD